MALSDTKLRSIHGKPYSDSPEVSDVDGLSVRISPKGVINFQFRYRWLGKAQRLGIGRYPSVGLKEARAITSNLRELYFKGIDPRTYFEKRDESLVTLEECLDYWYENYVKLTLRPKTQDLYKSTLLKRTDGLFPKIPLSSVTIKMWVDWLTKEERENSRRTRQVLSQLRTAIGWCIRRQIVDNCSVMKIQPRDFGTRAQVGSRVLSYNELAKIWLAIERSRASTANKLLHQMLMLWGARLSELLLSDMTEFDLNEKIWTVPKEHSKMGNIIRRPIFPAIEPLLNKAMLTYGKILFSGNNKNKPMTIASANKFLRHIREGMDLGYWRTHDFRRTLVTRLSEQGIMPHVTEKMLGHDLGGIMAVYNKHDWIDDQREAYQLHADKLFWHIKNNSG